MKYETCKVDEIQKVPFFKNVTIRDGSIQLMEFEWHAENYIITADYNGMKLAKNTDNLKTEYMLEGTINGFNIKPMYFETKNEAEIKAAGMTEAFITKVLRDKHTGFLTQCCEKETYISKDDESIF